MKFIGPPLEHGPLPALFYFALTAEESLHLDPYNQPVAHLQNEPLRIFSMTLPRHGEGFDRNKAVAYWKEHPEILEPFFEEVLQQITDLQDAIVPDKLAMAGLSRGAFIATHIAAREPQVGCTVGFAPLTVLPSLSLIQYAKQLIHTDLHYFIGNYDTLVGTRRCFEFVEAVAQAAVSQQIRQPRIELTIGRSIGRQGHGTAPETFRQGAEILRRFLCG